MKLEPRYAPCARCRSVKRCAHDRPAFVRCSEFVDADGVMVIDLTGESTNGETTAENPGPRTPDRDV